jgi:hypothetical protein
VAVELKVILRFEDELDVPDEAMIETALGGEVRALWLRVDGEWEEQ